MRRPRRQGEGVASSEFLPAQDGAESFDPAGFLRQLRGEAGFAAVGVPIPTKPPGYNGIMPPGSRASLTDGFLSLSMRVGQAFLVCFSLVRRKLSPASSIR